MDLDLSNVPFDLIINILNVVVFYLIIRLLVYKPVKKFLSARKKKIDKEREELSAARAEAETEKVKYGKLCDDAGKESAALLERTREEAEKTAAGIIGSAKADAEKLISDANANIAAREREAVSGMKDDVVDLSLSIASKLIARNIDNGDNRRLAADFFEKELGGMKR